MSKDYQVAVYYFPNYHVDPRNEAVHGEGWTEWSLTRHATPRYAGHRQPRVPLWGYEDESDPTVMAKKIDAAADHGVDAFIFDWYWYNDGPFLQRGLEEGFLPAPNAQRLRFSLMWANHDWYNIHPARYDGKHELQFPGRITAETFETMTDHIVETYFKHPSYWLIDGCPYFSIYDLQSLLESFGSLDRTVEAFETFRQKTRALGFPNLHLNAVVWGGDNWIDFIPSSKDLSSTSALIEALGFDSVTSYVYIHHAAMTEFPETPYEAVRQEYNAYRAVANRSYAVPYYPNVTMGWDASPRTLITDAYSNRGYPYTPSLSGATPEAFGAALAETKAFLADRPANQRILTINAWNEWTEGSYLEPDTVYGMGYLEAIKAVFGEDTE